jgi:hypothetical protein
MVWLLRPVNDSFVFYSSLIPSATKLPVTSCVKFTNTHEGEHIYSGIGKAATLKFATKSYHVIMACRNLKISTAVQRDIIEITKNNNVDLMEFDVLLLMLFVYFAQFLKSNIRGWTS